MDFSNAHHPNSKLRLRLVTNADETLSDRGSNSTDSLASVDSAIAINPGHRQLRRKVSPIGVSLRELRQKHAYQLSLKAQQSEEDLQRVYEAQIVAYLEGKYPSLDSIYE